MSTPPAKRSFLFGLAANGCALVSIAIGLTIIAASLFPLTPGIGISPRFSPMMFNTALCCMLAGTALWWRKWKKFRVSICLIVSLIGIFTISAYLTGNDFGIGRLDVVDSIGHHTFALRRMSAITALCFFLWGASCTLLSRARGALGFGFAEPLAFAVLAIIGIALLDDLGWNQSVAALPGFDSLPFQAAIALLFLSVGLISAVWECELLAGENFSKTSRQLGLGFSLLTLVLLVLGVSSSGRLYVISENLDALTDARLRAAVARELEIKVLGYALELRVFLAGDAAALIKAEGNAQEFAIQLGNYTQMAQTLRHRELASRCAWQWAELHTFGRQLVAVGQATQDDSQRLSVLRTRLQKVIDQELQPDAVAEFDSQKKSIFGIVESSAKLTLLMLIIGLSIAIVTSLLVTRAVLASEAALAESVRSLETAKLIAEKASLAKSDFLSSMSHELRSPLHAILGFAQLLNAGSPPPTPAQKEGLKHILGSGWHLLELINEVLDLSQVESGNLVLSLEPVSLPELLIECQTMIQPQALQHGASLAIAPFDAPCFVLADHTRLKQVLVNLLSNAVKYGGVNGAVLVDCRLISAGRIRVSVKDKGAGLSLDKLQQLFQPFNRLGQDFGSVQGTGIGLVLSKRLVEAMGGEIGAESTLGVGSVFWFELNTSNSPEPKLPQRHPAALVHNRAGSPLRTLLYVEDNPANLQLVKQLLMRRPDLHLLTAEKATLGIELARAHQPDLILMDINLPGISGIEALKILRSDVVTAHIPVVALSANAMPHDIELGIRAGFFQYLTKPVQLNQLMNALDAALDSRGHP